MNMEKKKNFFIPTHFRHTELLMDALTCMLLATGTSMAVLYSTVLAQSLLDCLIPTIAAVALISLLSRRWWLIPALIVILTAVFVLSHWLAGDLADTLLYKKTFILWMFSGFPYQEGVTDAGFLTAVYPVIILSISGILFVLIRKFFCFPVLIALETGVIFFCPYGGAVSQAALCMCAAGLIILLPRVNSRALIRMQKQTLDNSDSRVVLQVLAIPAAIIAVSLSLILIPQDTAGWKSHTLTVLIEDISSIIGRSSEWPRTASNFSMYRTGFQPNYDRLGGPAKPNKTRYLTVSTTIPVLLKGQVLDYYTGTAWLIGYPDGDMRFNSLFWRNQRREVFGIDMPSGTVEAERLYQTLTVEQSIQVRYDISRFNTLFSAGRISDIDFNRQMLTSEAYFNNRSELYMHANIPHASSYTLKTRVWNTDVNEFDSLFLQLEKEVGKDDRFSQISKRYTQLPDSLPDEVRQAAENITESITSPYLKVQAISRWLSKFGTYTLEPSIPPEGKDFTAWFLESGEGHCVYYATAMTVLARCIGVPARYVQGFALERAARGDNLYFATGTTAHAWSEVYFEGVGWMPVDPLSWSSTQNLNAARHETNVPEADTNSNVDTSQLEDEISNADDAVPQHEELNENAHNLIWVWLASISLLTAIVRWTFWFVPRYLARRWSLERVRHRHENTAEQVDALYQDILLLLEAHKVTASERETLISFPERADRVIKLDGVALSGVAETMMRLKFGELSPSADEVAYTCRYHELLEAYTLERLSKSKYMFFCIKRLLYPS